MTVEVLFQHDKNGESIDLGFLAELYHQSIAFQEFEKKSNLPSVPLNIFLPAWCHKSFLHEFKMEGVMSYERMEFLGDAIFGPIFQSDFIINFQRCLNAHYQN